MSLNHAQTEAVAHNKGPCMVLAGPGSGKTLTIAKRIEYHYIISLWLFVTITPWDTFNNASSLSRSSSPCLFTSNAIKKVIAKPNKVKINEYIFC